MIVGDVQSLIPRGFYTVGDQMFESKVLALAHSDQTGQHPVWNFHNEHFSQYNWKNEPLMSLEYYYQQRCQQIRDKYSYVVLHYSGGSDSHNILTNFYRQGLHIDEIVVASPVEYYEKYTKADSSREAGDLHNEWFRVVKPDIEWIAQNLPNTKITVYDYTKDVLNFDVDQDWILHAGEHMNPNVAFRLKTYHVIDRTAYDRKNVAHVYGIDKPFVFNTDGQWHFAFLDAILSIISSYKPAFDGHTHVHVENFYWSPDLPELLIKQAHLVKNFFINNPQFLHLATFKKKTNDERELYQDLVKSVIYPSWRKEIFQVKKSLNNFTKEFDQWFFDFADESAKGRWKEGYNYLLSTVNQKWINFDDNNNPSGLVGFWSKWHQLT
jgi:hypothetical protein